MTDQILCHDCGHDIDDHACGKICPKPPSSITLDYTTRILNNAPSTTSDGYHTFEELYEYRALYNAVAANLMSELCSKSWRHSDGEYCFGGGWFVVTMNLPEGQVTNHYPEKFWDLFQIPHSELAPPWDGHTPEQAAVRLKAHCLKMSGTK